MKAAVYSFTRRGARLSVNIGKELQKLNFAVCCFTMPKFAEEDALLEVMSDHNKACEMKVEISLYHYYQAISVVPMALRKH